MKKYSLLIIVIFVSLSTFSQNTFRAFGWKLTRDIQQHELKLNLGTTIFALYPEVTYERILAPDFSLGATAGVSLNSDDYFFRYSLLPYARWYFSGNVETMKKSAAGFFIEVNGALFSRDIIETIYEEDPITTREWKTGAGVGFSVGWKYVSVNNWVGEAYMGGGRDFVNDKGYPRMGVSIGKRF